MALAVASSGCVVDVLLPPTLEDQASMIDIVVVATVARPVANPATDSSTAEFADLDILWSGGTRTMADGTRVETPEPPQPLTAWAQWQKLDQYPEGTRMVLGLAYSPKNPYGEWAVTLALDAANWELPPEDLDATGDGENLSKIQCGLSVLFASVPDQERGPALIDVIEEQRETLFARNTGDTDVSADVGTTCPSSSSSGSS